MLARAGKAPWDPSSYTKGMSWDLSSGWAQRYSGYKKTKKYTSSGDVKTLHTAEGKEVKLYYSENYKNTKIGFNAHSEEDASTQEALAFAEDAFSRKEGVKSHAGAGHITNIEYAIKEQILRVSFANNGSTCIFFQVPTAVAGELLYLAGKGPEHKRSDGRHYLGITFWDLVRIRGQRTGARYPFEYETHGAYKLSGSNTRYRVQISAATYRKLFKNHKEFEIQEQIRPFQDGDIISVILSPDEMNLYAEFLNMVNDDKENRRMIERAGHHKKVTRTNEQGETVEDIMDLDDLSSEDVQSGTYARSNSYRQAVESAIAKQADAWRGMILDEAENIYNDPITKEIIRGDITRGKDLREANLFAFREVAKGLGRQDILKAIDQGDLKGALVQLKDSLSDNSHLARLAQIADGKGALQSWLKAAIPGAYANMTMQRGWTPQQLVEFANDTVPGGLEGRHKRAYKKYIDNRDWQGALDYLKRTDTTVELTGKNGKSTGKKYTRKYAGSGDFVAMED